jgi:hypothetical protein
LVGQALCTFLVAQEVRTNQLLGLG